MEETHDTFSSSPASSSSSSLCSRRPQEPDQAYANFLKAAQLSSDPDDTADALAHLGLHSQQVGGGESRAKACFAKALQSNPANETAGSALAALYLGKDLEDKVLALCEAATQADSRARWACLLLGASIRFVSPPLSLAR
jgi:Tfp pilus assembly protein PilF